MTRRNPFLFLPLAVAALAIVSLVAGDALMAQERRQLPLSAKEKGNDPEKPTHHGELERLVGHWSGQVRVYTEPGNEDSAIEGRGISSATFVMGGKFLQTDFKGEMRDQAFQGVGIDGYDSAREKHFAFWADSQSDTMTMFSGDCSEDGKTLTLYADSVHPETGADLKLKGITTIRSHQRYTYEQFVQNDEGDWLLVMRGIFSKQR